MTARAGGRRHGTLGRDLNPRLEIWSHDQYEARAWVAALRMQALHMAEIGEHFSGGGSQNTGTEPARRRRQARKRRAGGRRPGTSEGPSR